MYQSHYELMKVLLAWSGTIILIGMMILVIVSILYGLFTSEGRRIHKDVVKIAKDTAHDFCKEFLEELKDGN